MITRSEWNVRQQQWADYRRWVHTEAPLELAPEHSIADVGAILEWLPQHVRDEERDPERLGVQRMHTLLGLLKSR